MKNFVKFIPMALSLLTLASCSNDELLGEKALDASQLKEGEMLVDFEDASEYGDAFTRSYTDRTMKKHRWTETEDQLKVYGQDFGAYDLYAFSWATKTNKEDNSTYTVGVFKRQHVQSFIGSPKWALFPLKSVKKGTWTMGANHNSVTDVTMNLPKFVEYNAAYDAPNYQSGADKDPYYLDELPRFGEVGDVENGEALHTSMKYMTGVLRLQLAGIPSYATGVKIQMREGGDAAKTLVINGDFTTRIGTNNAIEVNGIAASMEDNHSGIAYASNADEDGAVYVHIPAATALTGKDSRKGVIFIPLPIWDKETSIAIATSTNFGGENPATGTKDYKTANWSEYKVLSKKVIERAKVYGNKTEYNLALDGTDPGAISDALDLIETDDETITIVANEEITVCGSESATTIEIPNNNPSVKNIIIDLSNGLGRCSKDTKTTLKIIYQNDANPFTGNVTLIAKPAKTPAPVKLDVNLPKSGFGIVAGQGISGILTGVFCQDAGDIDIDAKEFVVGNESKYTPTLLSVTPLKLSPNVKTFTVAKEGALVGDFVIDQETNADPEEWAFGAVETINVKGVVSSDGGSATGKIDAVTKTKADFKVAVKVAGQIIENSVFGKGKASAYEAPSVDGAILTRGTVDINAGKYVADGSTENCKAKFNGITAEGAITATGYATNTGAIQSTTATVELKDHVGTSSITADLDINVKDQAWVSGDITSTKGNITINNDYKESKWLGEYKGAITATAGNVSLNQAVNKESGKYLVAKYTGATITAGKDFTMTGLTWTKSAIALSGTATINVDGQEGACVAVEGSLTYQLGSSYKLNLLSGYVWGLDATDGEVELYFATTPAYAALSKVTKPENVLPKNESIWNGDWEIVKYPTFGTGGWAIDAKTGTEVYNRIWTATQLGYLQKTAQTAIQLRSDIDLNNNEWPGIAVSDATTFTGLIDKSEADPYYLSKTIKNVNLVNNTTNQKVAGFFSSATADLTVSNIHFDQVKTTLDMVATDVPTEKDKASKNFPAVDMWGVGAVLGSTTKKVTLKWVKATLVGEKFGSDGTENLRSARVGGLIGFATNAELLGAEVVATDATISGWFSLGGLIGHAEGDITIGAAAADGKLKTTRSNVKDFAVNVTRVDKTKTNDPYQGMTGSFIGSSYKDVIITNPVEALIKADFTKTGADESKAFKITTIGSEEHRHAFKRVDQTLVGHDGMYAFDLARTYKIDGVTYQVYMDKVPGYVPGTPVFYKLEIEEHNQ